MGETCKKPSSCPQKELHLLGDTHNEWWRTPPCTGAGPSPSSRGGSGWPPAASLSGSLTSFPAGEEIRGSRSYRGPETSWKEWVGGARGHLGGSALLQRCWEEIRIRTLPHRPLQPPDSRPFFSPLSLEGEPGRGVTIRDISPHQVLTLEPTQCQGLNQRGGLRGAGGWAAEGSSCTVLSALKGPPDQRFVSGNFSSHVLTAPALTGPSASQTLCCPLNADRARPSDPRFSAEKGSHADLRSPARVVQRAEGHSASETLPTPGHRTPGADGWQRVPTLQLC